MSVWFCLLIPFICVVVQILFWRRHIVWWELLLNIIVSIVVIVIAKALIEVSEISDKEYLGGYATIVYHEDEWDEWIEDTCYKDCNCKTDKQGTEHCDRCAYDCSYRKYHPDEKYFTDSNGKTWYVSDELYVKLLSQFHTKEEFIDMKRDYYRIDGDAHKFEWNGEPEYLEPTFVEHTYDNRIQASHSVYNLMPPDTSQIKHYGLHKYAEIDGYRQRHVYGWYDPKLDNRIERMSGLLGAQKQVKVNFLFFKNQDRSAAEMQTRYWNGGNKNELNVMFGVQQGVISWCEVMSWTESNELKTKIQHFAENNPHDIYAIANFVEQEVRYRWVRKQFKDFSYLTVEPTANAMTWSFIIVLLINIAVVYFNIKNDVT